MKTKLTQKEAVQEKVLRTEKLQDLFLSYKPAILALESSTIPSSMDPEILEEALELIEGGVNPNALVTLYSDVQIPCLSLASLMMSTPLMEALLKAGADPHQSVLVGPAKECIHPLWGILRHRSAPAEMIHLIMEHGGSLFESVHHRLAISYVQEPYIERASDPAPIQLAFELLLFHGRDDLANVFLEKLTPPEMIQAVISLYKAKRYNNWFGVSLIHRLMDLSESNPSQMEHLDVLKEFQDDFNRLKKKRSDSEDYRSEFAEMADALLERLELSIVSAAVRGPSNGSASMVGNPKRGFRL